MHREIEPWCHCDRHDYDPMMDHYRHLAEREKRLFEDLVTLSGQMSVLAGDILDHPCDNDDPKMKTIYQIDYAKRSYPIMSYRKLGTAMDSPVGVPVKPFGVGLREGYRDPTRFRLSAIPIPRIDSPPGVTMAIQPATVAEYHVDFPGETEYMDTISKVGRMCQLARQQYREPIPSTRRRHLDPCL